MATVSRSTRLIFTKADNNYKEVGHSLYGWCSVATLNDIQQLSLKPAVPSGDKFMINFGGLGRGTIEADVVGRYEFRRYNVFSQTASPPSVLPVGYYGAGLFRSSVFYGNTGRTRLNAPVILESFFGGDDSGIDKNCSTYNGDMIINYHTMLLEDYLSKIAPFSTAQVFVTGITLKTAPVPQSGKAFVTDFSEHTELNKTDFINYCKTTYGADCRVITGYDIIDYATREVVQTIDSFASSVSATTNFFDKCSRIPTVGWSPLLNTTVNNFLDVQPPTSSEGYSQSANWNNEMLYSELVFPLACNSTKMLPRGSYQTLASYFSLVYGTTQKIHNAPNYGHFFYTFQKQGDYEKIAQAGTLTNTANVLGYGVLGVWTPEQIDNYSKNCLGISYTIDDLDKAFDGEPENPPTGGEPGNPESSDPGSGDNTDDPVKPNEDYDSGISNATAWLLSDSEIKNIINPYFFGSAFLSDANALFRTGMNPFTAVYGLYRYNMSLSELGELAIGQKEFTCMGIPINLTDGTKYIGNYIDTASGMLSLNDGFTVTRYFGNFLDYEPYTTMTIYIPYCGFKEIPCNMVYGNTIRIKMAVDWLTGYCTAFITATDTDGNERLVTSVEGTCGMQKVFCGVDYSTSQRYLLKGILGGIASIGAGIIGGAIGGGAGLAAEKGISGGSDALFDSPLKNLSNAITTPPSLKISGNVAESLQGYAPQDCVIYVERTMPALPGGGRTDFNTQSEYVGRPAAYEGTVGSFKGFLSASAIKGDLNSPIITQDEKNMIYDYLRGGIYV